MAPPSQLSHRDGSGDGTHHSPPLPAPPPYLRPSHGLEEEEEEEGIRYLRSRMIFEPPKISLAEIRAAIPENCWEKDWRRSIAHVLLDVSIVSVLLLLAHLHADKQPWILWPLYHLAQGTMFWALFVLGHDCGHGSFSNSKTLNDIVGHLVHSSILVPYHGWRISHRTHHSNHGHVEKDESWHPLPEKLYRSLSNRTWLARFTLLFMFVYPFYLWSRSPGKSGSHFDPDSPLFTPRERKDVMISTACWLAMMAILGGLAIIMGPMWVAKIYVAPYWVFVMWLDLVTYLHHHGHHEKVPWYRGQEWSYTRGGLSTIDRDYGWFNKIHHDIGTHVVHHLFPQIPHYHLVEATEAIKPVLGKYYREPEKSGPFPTHLWKILVKSLSEDHYVSDEGDVVFYQTDKEAKAA